MTPPIRGKTWHPLTLVGPVTVNLTKLWGMIPAAQRRLFEQACAAKYLQMVNTGRLVFTTEGTVINGRLTNG